MQKDGTHTLQPTALLIKQAPNASATVNISDFPSELIITLRHIPQPEHLTKSYDRSNYTTYHAYLINGSCNTKTFLGPVSKLRPGTFQLIAGNIPDGTWDQLVVSLARDDPSELGQPIFTCAGEFSNLAVPLERYAALPADLPANQPQSHDAPSAKVKRTFMSTGCITNSSATSQSEITQQSTILPEFNKSQVSGEESPVGPYGNDEDMLLQPGTVLPEDGLCTTTSRAFSPSCQKTAVMEGPSWFDLGSTGEQSEQALIPIVINELPYHALWLVNYQGTQLVGYAYAPADPKKPMFIVHGVSGDCSRKAKPKERGYDYWVANPIGKSGYWLRYVNPGDNLIAHPFPVTEIPRK